MSPLHSLDAHFTFVCVVLPNCYASFVAKLGSNIVNDQERKPSKLHILKLSVQWVTVCDYQVVNGLERW